MLPAFDHGGRKYLETSLEVGEKIKLNPLHTKRNVGSLNYNKTHPDSKNNS